MSLEGLGISAIVSMDDPSNLDLYGAGLAYKWFPPLEDHQAHVRIENDIDEQNTGKRCSLKYSGRTRRRAGGAPGAYCLGYQVESTKC
jgi:hypothetical protein